jgi:hypothetical protein
MYGHQLKLSRYSLANILLQAHIFLRVLQLGCMTACPSSCIRKSSSDVSNAPICLSGLVTMDLLTVPETSAHKPEKDQGSHSPVPLLGPPIYV